MASIRFKCPYCGRKIEVDERGAGLEVPCPECAQIIVIPGADAEAPGGPDSPLSTAIVRLSMWKLARRQRVVIAGWLCLFAVAAITRQWTAYAFACAPLLLVSFLLSIVAIQQRRVVHGVLILAFSLSALPLLYQDVFTSVFHPSSGEPSIVPLESVPDAGRETPSAVPKPPQRLFVDDGERAELPPPPAAEKVYHPVRPPAPTAPARVASVSRRVPPAAAQSTRIPRILEKITFPFVLYGDSDGLQPFCPSGWMGNIFAIEIDDCCEKDPHGGKTCIKCTYNARGKWAGVAWQDPPNNWGDVPGGFDLTGATKLTFWARGETGRETIEFKVGMLGVSKAFPDTARATTGKVALSTQWHEYSIDLGGKNLQRIISGFVWIVEGGPSPITFYLDDIAYE